MIADEFRFQKMKSKSDFSVEFHEQNFLKKIKT